MLCNVVDTPELCSFILPAVFRRDPIALAVSTGGASPALAKRLRDELGARIERPRVTPAARCDARPRAARAPLGSRPSRRPLRTGTRPRLTSHATSVRRAAVGRGGDSLTSSARGPGDPGLVTVRGLELIRSCDVLVYDRLVSRRARRARPAPTPYSSRATARRRRRSTRCSSRYAQPGRRGRPPQGRRPVRVRPRRRGGAGARRGRRRRSRSCPASPRSPPRRPQPVSRSPTAASRRR